MLRTAVGLICEDLLPFSIMNSNNIRRITTPICEEISAKRNNSFTLNSTNTRQFVINCASHFRDIIKNELKNNLINLKIDQGSRLERSIFGE